MPQLRITGPDGQALEPVAVDNLPLQIGRGEEADLRLDDGSVSRLHAIVGRSRDQTWIQDHASLNGVWVNGKRVETRVELKNRDRIMVGDFELIYLA